MLRCCFLKFSGMFISIESIYHENVTTYSNGYCLQLCNAVCTPIRGTLGFSLQPATLLKLTLLHGCFSCFYIVQMVPDRAKQQKCQILVHTYTHK